MVKLTKVVASINIKIVDSTSGALAKNVSIETRKIIDGDWHLISQTTTDEMGNSRLVDAADFSGGGYFEALLFLGNYFSAQSYPLPQMKFVDIVPLRFGVEPDRAGCDIVLSVSPYGYTVVQT